MSLKKKENQAVESLSEISVVNYLRKKRDFFEKNYEILSELKIPHESGTAVSLIEKQLFLLREENQKINKQMCELIEIARQNNELALRMHQLILTLMGDNNPSETFSLMYESLKKNFHADSVVVRLFADPIFIDPPRVEEFVGKSSEDESLFKNIIESREPQSGKINRQQEVFLFGDKKNDIASSVIIPLHGFRWTGVLAIGSFDAEYFKPGMGIELLANLGEILSFIIKPWVEKK